MGKRLLALTVLVAAAHGVSDTRAQAFACGAPGPAPKAGEIKLVSWNIAELAAKEKVHNRPVRSAKDFEDLARYARCNNGDVYGLQEIASAQALARVFPPSEYLLCIAGQTLADERGLAPQYPKDKLTDIQPQ
jgi:hypothetical protein